MLAFMSHPPPPSLPTHTHMSNSTMSLAILPSAGPMPYSQVSTPALLPPSPSPAKRPKLSLDTNNVPSIYGNGSTSLRLDTLSATSPTARNTFKNAFNPTQSQRTKPTLAPLSTTNISSSTSKPELKQSDLTPANDSASSSASASSILTIDSLPSEIPYKLTYSVTSILTNSPFHRKNPVRTTSFANSKPMFPALKKVAFRTPLTEEVKNVKFTMRHSDIESSTSTISTLELSPSSSSGKKTSAESSSSKGVGDDDESTECIKKAPASPQTGDKRESSDEEEGEDSDSIPQTPGPSGRRKRNRVWTWTLPTPLVTDGREPEEEEQQKKEEEEEEKAS